MNAPSLAPFDWDDLRVFLALAREGRLGRASKLLGVERTTVARRIEAFEHRLQAPLFHRTTAGHLLTPIGRRVLAASEAMEQNAVSVWNGAREESKRLVGRVRLAIIESFATVWLREVLPDLERRHPGIDLEVLTGNAQTDLSRGEAELAVRTPKPRRAALTAYRLSRSSVGIYATRELLKRHHVDLDADPPQARGAPLLVYSEPLAFMQSAKWFERVLASGQVRMTTNSTLLMLAAAMDGAGLAVLPRFIARRHPTLVAASGRHASTHDLWLVSHPEFRRDLRVQAVAQVLKDHAPGLAD